MRSSIALNFLLLLYGIEFFPATKSQIFEDEKYNKEKYETITSF